MINSKRNKINKGVEIHKNFKIGRQISKEKPNSLKCVYLCLCVCVGGKG